MGVYIKGMEIPQSCSDCPMCYDMMECAVADPHIVFWKRQREDFDFSTERHTNCPLVPVPDHGPLVDVLDVLDTFPDEYIFTNEQARALTNYIIPADKEDE